MNEWQERMGVGEPQRFFGRYAGGNKITKVIADDGPMRGQATGTQTEHWSGRVDATICPPPVAVKVAVKNPGA